MTLTKDIRQSVEDMNKGEIRHLVTSYYQVQEFRKASENMARSQEAEGRPYELVKWLADEQRGIENSLRGLLRTYAANDLTGGWLMSLHGIGPVIAAGLLAHIDIRMAPTVGHVWSFAGLNPGQVWGRGERRPWNAELKVLCFKIGDSFVKTSGSDKSVYGPIYRQRKIQELERNDAGLFAATAADTLASRHITDPALRACYESGKLPLGRLDLRARRIAVKLFLSHFHDVLMWHELGWRAPTPYAIEHMGHVHEIKCPNPPWPTDQQDGPQQDQED